MTTAITWSNIQGIYRENHLFKDAHHWLLPLLEDSHDWPTATHLNRVAGILKTNFDWEFVPQTKVPRRAKSRGDASLTGYIAMIGSQGKIPFREKNVHDFLNCLSFLMFPSSKAQLNLRHFKESPTGLKPGQNRTRTQDLLTIFDEGGVIRLINDRQSHKDLIFGHAVYEHILYGKTLRAARLDLKYHGELLNNDIVTLIEFADESFAAWLKNPDNCLSPKEFSHVWIPAPPATGNNSNLT